MRVAVVGAGAIGGWVAARLALAGTEVMALTSRGPVDRLELSEGGSTETARFERFEGPVDLLIIAVKAPALPAVAQGLPLPIGPGTTIVPMLNGIPWWFVEGQPLRSVDPQGSIAAALPLRQIVGCVVHASCSRPEPGRIVVTHADKLIIGEPEGGETTERVARLFAILDEAGLRPDVSGNVRRAIWYKLWGNATINPLSALTRATADRILADPECRAWMLEGMAELAAVGARVGCPIRERARSAWRSPLAWARSRRRCCRMSRRAARSSSRPWSALRARSPSATASRRRRSTGSTMSPSCWRRASA